jgi:hypothetical protein
MQSWRARWLNWGLFLSEIVRLPSVPTLEQIQAFESLLRNYPQIEIETFHHFAPGIYAREARLKAGTVATGKMHAGEHLNIISAGAIEVWTEDGMKVIRAPFTFVSLPGTKRVGLALLDTVWTTIHANPDNEKSLATLEGRYIIPEQINLNPPPRDPELEVKNPIAIADGNLPSGGAS